MARKYVWTDGECGKCYGMGLVLPKENALADDCELELCPDCNGYGRRPRRQEAWGLIYGLVASMLMREGAAWRTRAEALRKIEEMYG